MTEISWDAEARRIAEASYVLWKIVKIAERLPSDDERTRVQSLYAISEALFPLRALALRTLCSGKLNRLKKHLPRLCSLGCVKSVEWILKHSSMQKKELFYPVNWASVRNVVECDRLDILILFVNHFGITTEDVVASYVAKKKRSIMSEVVKHDRPDMLKWMTEHYGWPKPHLNRPFVSKCYENCLFKIVRWICTEYDLKRSDIDVSPDVDQQQIFFACQWQEFDTAGWLVQFTSADAKCLQWVFKRMCDTDNGNAVAWLMATGLVSLEFASELCANQYRWIEPILIGTCWKKVLLT